MPRRGRRRRTGWLPKSSGAEGGQGVGAEPPGPGHSACGHVRRSSGGRPAGPVRQHEPRPDDPDPLRPGRPGIPSGVQRKRHSVGALPGEGTPTGVLRDAPWPPADWHRRAPWTDVDHGPRLRPPASVPRALPVSRSRSACCRGRRAHQRRTSSGPWRKRCAEPLADGLAGRSGVSSTRAGSGQAAGGVVAKIGAVACYSKSTGAPEAPPRTRVIRTPFSR